MIYYVPLSALERGVPARYIDEQVLLQVKNIKK
jgi:hypothetical protein